VEQSTPLQSCSANSITVDQRGKTCGTKTRYRILNSGEALQADASNII